MYRVFINCTYLLIFLIYNKSFKIKILKFYSVILILINDLLLFLCVKLLVILVLLLLEIKS
jgi:hypothetical protein